MTAPPVAASDTLVPTIPVFPLSGALLLPRGENCRSTSLKNAIVTWSATRQPAHGLIGMIQPTEPERTAARPDLYTIGCVGRMSALREMDDGRYYLTLVGLCRYDVVEELTTSNSYRQVLADYNPYQADLDPAETPATDRKTLLAALEDYLDAHDLGTDWEQIHDVGDETLINALAMMCPFEPREKQALLEAPGLAERADILITLFAMTGISGAGEAPASMQ